MVSRLFSAASDARCPFLPPYCSGARRLNFSALYIMSLPSFLLLMLNSEFINVIVLIFSMS